MLLANDLRTRPEICRDPFVAGSSSSTPSTSWAYEDIKTQDGFVVDELHKLKNKLRWLMCQPAIEAVLGLANRRLWAADVLADDYAAADVELLICWPMTMQLLM
ncbi:hypothetical protein PoB_002257300 [Plakobranchus ocellatus]|uniref:Uncharacterized protein n=1 Tax=Plakobranchus ocellatus TaxID=259542 RepID=A0AAV3ZNK9_9GAST|nr:hypothetical protein PoB_002257300 [Plakobranchus ocellatus]